MGEDAQAYLSLYLAHRKSDIFLYKVAHFIIYAQDILNAGYVAPEVRSSHPYNPVASSNTSVYPCQPAVTPQPVCTPKTTSSAPKIMITAYTAGDQESTSHSPGKISDFIVINKYATQIKKK